MCQSRVKDAANGPGMSLIEEKYRRHTRRLNRPTPIKITYNDPFIVMLTKSPCVWKVGERGELWRHVDVVVNFLGGPDLYHF